MKCVCVVGDFLVEEWSYKELATEFLKNLYQWVHFSADTLWPGLEQGAARSLELSQVCHVGTGTQALSPVPAAFLNESSESWIIMGAVCTRPGLPMGCQYLPFVTMLVLPQITS